MGIFTDLILCLEMYGPLKHQTLSGASNKGSSLVRVQK